MRRIRSGFFQHFLKLGDQARLVEMSAEEAHIDRDFWKVFAFPILKLKAGLLERPCIDHAGDAGLLGDGDELALWDQAALRVVPAELGFEANHFFGLERDDREI